MQEMVYYDPSSPVGPIPSGVIQALPEREGFTILIYNFMRRLKGKFKCPIFAGHELDLHRVSNRIIHIKFLVNSLKILVCFCKV